MQVSKILIAIILGLAVTAFVASPAVALEHPWEEGETGTIQPGDGMPHPDDDIPPGQDQRPWLSSIAGSGFFWWYAIIDCLSGDNMLTLQATDAENAVNPEDIKKSHFDRMNSTLR